MIDSRLDTNAPDSGVASETDGGGHSEVKIAIYAAFFGNLIIAIFKLYAAIDSGSSGMFAETAHSFADAGNQLILLFGIPLSVRAPDQSHPFGYGKDRYFWTFMAAVSMFTIGAGEKMWGMH